MDEYEYKWIPFESRYEMQSFSENSCKNIRVETNDPNSWGVFQVNKIINIEIGYNNIGLLPISLIICNCFVIGINEIVFFIDLIHGKILHKYIVPTIFHNFILYNERLILCDETGFVEISMDGKEKWKKIFPDIINSFSIRDGSIVGSTFDGENFVIPLGEKTTANS